MNCELLFKNYKERAKGGREQRIYGLLIWGDFKKDFQTTSRLGLCAINRPFKGAAVFLSIVSTSTKSHSAR